MCSVEGWGWKRELHCKAEINHEAGHAQTPPHSCAKEDRFLKDDSWIRIPSRGNAIRHSSPPYGLFTLHGSRTGTGTGNRTGTTGDNGSGPGPISNPLFLVLLLVPLPVPVPCSVNVPSPIHENHGTVQYRGHLLLIKVKSFAKEGCWIGSENCWG